MKITVRLAALLLLIPGVSGIAAAKKKPAPPLATVNFIVVRDENGKPIRNAAVVMHPVNDHGRQERGGFELKTDGNGKTTYDGVPYGKIRIQVLATGFQTYGEDYNIDQSDLDITVKMKRPAGQYSIYEDHPAENKEQKPPEDDKKPQ